MDIFLQAIPCKGGLPPCGCPLSPVAKSNAIGKTSAAKGAGRPRSWLGIPFLGSVQEYLPANLADVLVFWQRRAFGWAYPSGSAQAAPWVLDAFGVVFLAKNSLAPRDHDWIFPLVYFAHTLHRTPCVLCTFLILGFAGFMMSQLHERNIPSGKFDVSGKGN
jgi:hypothetical protein